MYCRKCHTHIPWGEFRCENPDCGKDAGARVCRTCRGEKEVIKVNFDSKGRPYYARKRKITCPECGGTGKSTDPRDVRKLPQAEFDEIMRKATEKVESAYAPGGALHLDGLCPACEGKGLGCNRCDGTGKEESDGE